MPNRQQTALGTAVGAIAGFMLGRATSNFQTRRLLGSNYKWMSGQERGVARSLINHGQHHVFKAWPKAGVNDDAKRKLLTAAANYLTGAAGSLEAERLSVLSPPLPEKQSKLLQTHDDTREDCYYWLRDDDRKCPAVLSYLKTENEYTAAAMADTKQLQDDLYKEMRARIQEADTSVATRYQGYYYYTRTEEGQQYAVHCRRAVPQGSGPPSESDEPSTSEPEEVLLDENKRKTDGKHSFYMVGSCDESPNQQLLAWTEDTKGGEKYTLHVKDLSTGKELMSPIHSTSGDVMWANDNNTIFYIVKDHLDRPYKVLRHSIGQQGDDQVVYEEKDEAFYVGIGRSHSEQLLYIHSGSAVTNETSYLSADDPTGNFTVILPRTQDVEYSVSHHPGSSSSSKGGGAGWFLVVHRDLSKPNSELRAVPVDIPTQHKVLLPHRDDVKIEHASVGAKWIVVSERSKAQQSVVIYPVPEGGVMPESLSDGHKVEFEEPAYSLSGGLTGDFDSEVLRLRYSSLTTPSSVYDQRMDTGKRALKKVQPILGGFSKDDYVTQRLWATAPDGVQVRQMNQSAKSP